MSRSAAMAMLGLGLMAAPAHGQTWADFSSAFPMFPCHDGWAGCVVEGEVIQPDLVADTVGMPTRSDLRVGWFDLRATAAFSPFTGLSEYTGELPWAPVEEAPVEPEPVEEEVAVVDAAAIEAELDDEGRAAIEEAQAAEAAQQAAEEARREAEAAAEEARRQQEEAERQAREEAARQQALLEQAKQAEAAEAERLRKEAEVAAQRAAAAEAQRKAAEEESRRREEERQARLAAEAEASRLAEEKRIAEEEARRKAEEEARRKAEAEAEARRVAAAEAAAAEAAARAEAEAEAAAAAEAEAEAEAAIAEAEAIEPPAPPPQTCALDELVRLEPQAMLGKLADAQIASCEETLASATKMTDKGKVSRVLMVNAFSKGDKATWEQLVKRHLDEIDQSDPDLCYKYALHLSKKGAGRASGVIRWADVALENRTLWTGDTYTSRVYSLYKLRAIAAQALWQSAEKSLADDPSEEVVDKVEKFRAMTKVMAREWFEYAKVAGKDTTKALQLCMSAAGTKDYCEAS